MDGESVVCASANLQSRVEGKDGGPSGQGEWETFSPNVFELLQSNNKINAW